jgi:acyl-CoA reductase-like NAD-dependent aldehyde dehydrogenase
MLINGEWRNGSSGSTFTLHDPATGQEITRVRQVLRMSNLSDYLKSLQVQ